MTAIQKPTAQTALHHIRQGTKLAKKTEISQKPQFKSARKN